MWLMAVLMFALAACGSGSSGQPHKSDKVEEQLTEIAAKAESPVYYLGPQFRDWPLTEALADGTGRVDAIYGSCDATFDSCAAPLDLINQPLDREAWSVAVGCSRLTPVRGVPAVHFGDALVLLTGTSVITLGVAGDDMATAIAAAEQLREVGAELSREALPPPDPAALQALDAACGKNPDAGRALPDVEQEPAQKMDMRVPDFTVERLGGGDLRWATYRGKSVVVVVGDVPDVLAGIRRVRAVGRIPRPVIIGLVWKPFGSKVAPAPIAVIEQEAGNVPVPVGYAAIPRPAVWFFDKASQAFFNDPAQVDPGKTGVIAFVNAEGEVVRILRTDAGDGLIADAFDELVR
jgi:hypothetical protein